MRNACFVGGKAEKTMCKTCFVKKDEIKAEKNIVFVGEDSKVTPESPNKKIKVGQKKRILDANGNKCRTYYVNDGSTGNAINHLLNDHEITNEGKKIKSNAKDTLKYLQLDKILQNTLSSNTDSDSKRDAKRLKQIMISDHEWDLLTDLTEILSTFANVTEDLGESNYVTDSICALMLVEIIKTLRIESTNLSDDQDFNIDEQKDNVFENNEEQNPMLNYDINEPISTFGLLRKYDIEI
ncbi:18403_t:CDS:2 [Funneliformis geosporum]|uniref:18403_t:CDS:1 n=1 Tax=Funneliformis geosporum TaxID=1117311 RepID=A0A9W4SPQ1_9GLOM|nr:18403_t:CDS:2 [Funneliformis geosporum]